MYYFVATEDIPNLNSEGYAIALGQVIPLIDLPGLCDAHDIQMINGTYVDTFDNAHAMGEIVANSTVSTLDGYSTRELLNELFARMQYTNGLEFCDRETMERVAVGLTAYLKTTK